MGAARPKVSQPVLHTLLACGGRAHTHTHTLHTVGSGADTRHTVTGRITGSGLGPGCWESDRALGVPPLAPEGDHICCRSRQARALYATAWRNASDWRDASYPAAARVLAVTAAAAGLVGCRLSALPGASREPSRRLPVGLVGCHLSVLAACFARVTVADRFDAPPISGNPLNVVRGGAGYALLASFLGGLLLLLLHRAWLGRRTRARLVVEEAAVARRGPDKAMAPKGAAEAPVLEQGKVWGVHY